MGCSCGGLTKPGKVVREQATVAEKETCRACGRVHYVWFAPGWSREKIAAAADAVTG